MATRQAAAGRYQSRNGEDFVQYMDESGNVVHSVDSQGIIYAPMIKFSDGSIQSSATPGNVGGTLDAGTF